MTELTAEIVRELLDYNPETGDFYWKYRDVKWFNSQRACNSWNTKYAGNKTFCLYRNKYLGVVIFHKKRLAHRIAWLYVHGEWPDGQIDHINNVRDDNRIINLRVVTANQNQHNQKRAQRDNKSSGLLGVTFNKANKNWVANIHIKGKQKHIGCYDCKHEAHEAYLEVKAKYHSGYVGDNYR